MDGGAVLGGLLEAAHFAASKHRDQRRKDRYQSPYINHPIGVAYLLWKEGGVTDLATLQAALLHDTIEDTATCKEEIEEMFGEEVKGIVMEVSDDKSLAKWERKRQQIEHAPHKSHKAKLVSLGDKLYNLRDLDSSPPASWDPARTSLYFQWAAQPPSQFIHHLRQQVVSGLRGTNSALEAAVEEVLNRRGASLLSPSPDTSCDTWRQYSD